MDLFEKLKNRKICKNEGEILRVLSRYFESVRFGGAKWTKNGCVFFSIKCVRFLRCFGSVFSGEFSACFSDLFVAISTICRLVFRLSFGGKTPTRATLTQPK